MAKGRFIIVVELDITDEQVEAMKSLSEEELKQQEKGIIPYVESLYNINEGMVKDVKFQLVEGE